MGKPADLTDQRFGRLVAIERAGNDKHGHAMWRCVCDCGQTKTTLGTSLLTGNTASCGCLKSEICRERIKTLTAIRTERGEAGFTKVLGQYKLNARRRGYRFQLTDSEFRGLITSACFYCNAPPNKVSQHGKACAVEAVEHSAFIYNGIDRVNNKVGYELGNVVTCCETCNRAKLAMSTEEFFRWLKAVTVARPWEKDLETSCHFSQAI